MDNGDADPLIRTINDDPVVVETATPPEHGKGRWLFPLLTFVGVLGAFMLLTRPDATDTDDTIAPALISAVEVETIDLTTARDEPATTTWGEVPGIDGAVINDMVATTSLFIAVGSEGDTAGVWTTGTGIEWNPISQLDLPEAETSSLDHVALFNDKVIALGTVDGAVALWAADLLTHWEYQGTIDAFDGHDVFDLAAGKELLAVATPESQVSAWLSPDGREWRSLGRLHDLDGSAIVGITADADAYYAYGFSQPDDGEPDTPIVFRSPDGLTWTGTELPGPGEVRDLVVDKDRLIATGWIDSPGGTRLAVWESHDDGTTWTLFAEDEALHKPVSLSLEILWIRNSPQPAAQMSVGGNIVEITEGSVLRTEVGDVAVDDIKNDSVTLEIGGHSTVISTPQTFEFLPLPQGLAIEGPRLVVTGALQAESWRTPVVWASADGGNTWTREPLPGTAPGEEFIGLRGSVIVAIGSDGRPWRSTWTDDAAAAVATDVVERYVDALNSRDAGALATTIPVSLADLETARFQVPSLGREPMTWWTETGELDESRLADTLDYLKATTTSVEIVGDCTTAVSLGTSDRVNVTCAYQVLSDLLTAYGLVDNAGQLRAVVRDGIIESVLLEPAPSLAVWNTLNEQLTDATGGEAAAPVFDASSALVHLSLAEEYVAGLFLPGDTKVVETLFGTMEWTWHDPEELSIENVGGVDWTQFGFIAVDFGGWDTDQSPSLWQSDDGREWTRQDLPEGLHGVWNVQDFGDGLIAHSWRGGVPGLIFFDGTTWQEIAIPPVPTGQNLSSFIEMAVGEDAALALPLTHTEEGLEIGEAFLVDTDLNIRPATVPVLADLDPYSYYPEIVATETGFLLMLPETPSSETTVWTISDGEEWLPSTDDVDRGDALNFGDLQRLGSDYFAFGVISHIACGVGTNPEECWHQPTIWISADATTWRRVATDTGDVVAARQLGLGPLGFASISEDYADRPQPHIVYLSHDGATWYPIDDLALFDLQASWWWSTPPAIGTDTIIIVGATMRDDAPTGAPFMIIGRLVDG